LDDDTLSSDSSNKKARLVSDESTVDKPSTGFESTPNVSNILELINSNPNLAEFLRKQYGPKMREPPSGSDSIVSSVSVLSSQAPPSSISSSEDEMGGASDEEEPMEITDDVPLRTSKSHSGPSSEKGLGTTLTRSLFHVTGLSDASKWQHLYAAIRLDYISMGPDPSSLEGNITTADKTLQIEMIERRYKYIFGPSAPKLTPLQMQAVHPDVIF